MAYTSVCRPNILQKEFLTPKQGQGLFNEVIRKNLSKYTKQKLDEGLQHEEGTFSQLFEGSKQHLSVSNLDKLLSLQINEILHRVAKQVRYNGELDAPASNMMIDILVNKVTIKFTFGSEELLDRFSCKYCTQLLYEPVTLLCGHTYCKSCVSKAKTCNHCNQELNATSLSQNILLTMLLQKCHTAEYMGRGASIEGDKLMKEKRYQDAIAKYSEAIQFAPYSHATCLSRAKANIICGKWENALEDAIRTEILAKKCAEVYLIKGEILQHLEFEDEALLSYLSCLALEPGNAQATEKVKQITRAILARQKARYTRTMRASKRPRTGRNSPDAKLRKKIRATTNEIDYDEETFRTAPLDLLRLESDVDLPDVLSSTVNGLFLCGGYHSTHTPMALNDLGPSIACEPELQMILNKEMTSHDFKVSDGCSEPFLEDGTDATKSMSDDALSIIIAEFESSTTGDFQLLSELSREEEASRFINPSLNRVVDKSLIEADDFECSLCMRIFFDPVCTPCGHLFCSECLERCLDYSAACPLCKAPIKQYVKNNRSTRPVKDESVDSIMRHFLTNEFEERTKQRNEEIDKLKELVPIFVCTLAFPSVPCPLHIYEARYRLMLRRVVDIYGHEFGICKEDSEKPFSEIGTMLHVQSTTFFPDGRSVLMSVGSRRFRVLEYLDSNGYHAAKVQYITDLRVKSSQDLAILNKLLVLVHTKCKLWFAALESSVMERIVKHFGDFPDKDENMGDNGPNWIWWVVAILPVEDKIKMALLGKNLLRERVLILNRIVTCLRKKQAT